MRPRRRIAGLENFAVKPGPSLYQARVGMAARMQRPGDGQATGKFDRVLGYKGRAGPAGDLFAEDGVGARRRPQLEFRLKGRAGKRSVKCLHCSGDRIQAFGQIAKRFAGDPIVARHQMAHQGFEQVPQTWEMMQQRAPADARRLQRAIRASVRPG